MTSLLLALAAAACAQTPVPSGAFDGTLSAPAPLVLPKASPPPPAVVEAHVPPPANVILITWDGVRARDVFSNTPDRSIRGADSAAIVPYLHSVLLTQGVLYGDATASEVMSVANLAFISLPAYQSIMAGATQPCVTNTCGRIGVETLQERLVRELGLPKDQVASIASWEQLANAVEHVPGATTVDVAAGTRLDADTWPRAMSYLKTRKPRFLYISLNDSDEWGHRDNYPEYLKTLRQYDQWLKELVAALDSLGDYGARTTVLVTTDHGRGQGAAWKDHGWGVATSENVWLYARGPTIVKRGQLGAGTAHSHLDIRPTVEALLGLTPLSGSGYGSPFPEIVHP